MDSSVIRALAKWPNVPDVFGWLGLDRRGRWRIKGETIGNRAAREFIDRNYGADDRGRWFFQNGPQRVFVELAYTPWVIVLDGAGRLAIHTGAPVHAISGAWIDDESGLLLATEHGPGAVSDRDLAPIAERFTDPGGRAMSDGEVENAVDRLAAGEPDPVCFAWGEECLPVGTIRAAEVPARFGFEPRPAPD